MAQDYWHGGWANGGMLPGTRAAMTAKSAGGSYGPLNALADILGAYWQKKDRDDANKAIEDYENNFDSLVSPQEAPQVSAPSVLEGLTGGQEQSLIQPGQFGSKEWGEQNLQPQPKPLSVSEYATNAKTAMSKAARNLARKYGYGNMQDAIKELQDITNQRVLSYAGQARDDFYGAMGGGLTQESLPALLKRADEYNSVVVPLGGTPINLKDIVGMFANKVANVDTGGSIVQQVAPANGLAFRNVPVTDEQGNVIGYRPEYTRTAGALGKSLSPKDLVATRETHRHNLATEGETQRHNRTSEGISAANAQTSRDKYGLEREKYQYLRDKGLYGKKGGAAGKAAQGISNSISSALNEINGFISSGDTEKARVAMEDMYDMIEKGYKDGTLDEDDKQFFEDIWRGKRFEYYKSVGQDDEAAWEASQMSPDGWAAQYGQRYGKQPYRN